MCLYRYFLSEIFIGHKVDETLTHSLCAKSACPLILIWLHAADIPISRRFQDARSKPDQTIRSLAQRANILNGPVKFNQNLRQGRKHYLLE